MPTVNADGQPRRHAQVAELGRLVRTRGTTKARKAVGHSLLAAVWHILDAGVPYAELGEDWFDTATAPSAVPAAASPICAPSVGRSPRPVDDVLITPPVAA